MQSKCKLLQGWFGGCVQLLLAVIALCSLWYKRAKEWPQRDLNVWAFDVAKQGGGAAFAHILNILIAFYLSHLTHGSGDQCAWYFINYAIDIGFGTFLSCFLLKILSAALKLWDLSYLYNTGNYGNPPSVGIWLGQFALWLGITFIVKILLFFFQLPLLNVLSGFGNKLFSPMQEYPNLELVIVMVICPCIFNVLQFWILDTVLKDNKLKVVGKNSEITEQLIVESEM